MKTLKSTKHPKTNPSVGKVRLNLEGRRVGTWQDIVGLLFDNEIRRNIAIALLQEVANYQRQGSEFTRSEWPKVILSAMKNDPQLEEYAERMAEKFSELEASGIPRSELERALREYGEQLAEELGIEEKNPWVRYRGAYFIVLRVLERAGMIMKKRGTYVISDNFSKKLRIITKIWEDFALKTIENTLW
ncbi:hypothetical protein [Thermococcus sp.]|uniref:hypothetical protein n=1 Tax=Thermococcus sp. TaxID=35749 RepID=UPI0019BE8F8C|nr:hypothetical protein [Thermococcus sp.]MBC7094488.1 hypothetical protein [Thermococcus sp.]